MRRMTVLLLGPFLVLTGCDGEPVGPPDAGLIQGTDQAVLVSGRTLDEIRTLRDGAATAAPFLDDASARMQAPAPSVVLAVEEVVITFDEFPAPNANDAVLSDEYESEGVIFVTDDGVVRDGLGDGDPGNWGLSGTNGDQFLGFNGESYAATLLFSGNVGALSVDVARSLGSADGDGFELRAFCEGDMVASDDVVFGAVNTWSTASVAALCIDEVTMLGTGAAFHPYGADNLHVTFDDLDDDGDGVTDDVDLCDGTEIPDPLVPTDHLEVNRFALVDDDDVFDTAAPGGRGPEATFSTADTGGCNAGQIADALGLGKGHYRFGVSLGVMRRWVAMVAGGGVS